MSKIRIRTGVLGASFLALGQPLAAHHSFAMFDQTRISELRGASVVQFQWANPHVFVVIKKDEITYTLECGSPSNLSKTGWKFTSLKPGDRISVSFYQLRNGKPGGALKVATLPNGSKLNAW